MADFATQSIHDALQERLDEALRGVVCYDGLEMEYALREDVAELYTDSDIRAFVDNSIVHQLGQPDAERVYELGRLEAVVRMFERSWVVRMSTGRDPKRGCLFSVERDRGVSMTAIEDCFDIVKQQVKS